MNRHGFPGELCEKTAARTELRGASARRELRETSAARTELLERSAGALRVWLVLASLLGLAPPCYCSSGCVLQGARSAGLGGIAVVGKSASALRVAVPPEAGLLIEISWANPYGISDLEIAALSIRHGWAQATAAGSVQSFQTGLGYSELHVMGAASARVLDGFTLGAVVSCARLQYAGDAMSGECSVAQGVTVNGPSGLEIGCAVLTPLDASRAGRPAGLGAGAGSFRWGVGLPLAGGALVLFEEERGLGRAARRIGSEVPCPGGVALRVGISDHPFTVSVGVGIARRRFGLDMALVSHSALGVTPHTTISYCTASRCRQVSENKSDGG